MSFEEWWNTKDYPVSCKGNCKEAYEAGLHADVHTDNSAVIADLEKENADLRDNYDQFKAIAEPEIERMQKENAELKGIKDVATLIRANNDTVVTLMQLNNMLVSERQQLTNAKEIIKKIEKIFYSGENALKRLSKISDILAEAEQFLNSELQSKWINPARTTNDNEIKLNSEVEK